MTDAIDGLPDGQRDCLRLVWQDQTSKDIARTLGISPHTVDRRVKQAIRTLGVANRREAARLLAAHEQQYQSLVYQSPAIDDPRRPPPAFPQAFRDGRPGNGAGREPRSHAEQHARSRPSRYRFRVPYATSEGQRNDLTTAERLIAITVLAIAAAMAFGAILAGMQALGQLF